MTDSEYLQAIAFIWKKYQPLGVELAQLRPLCYTELPSSGLLIMGLNPSLQKHENKEALKGQYEPLSVSNVAIQAKEEKHSYHNALKRIVEEVRLFSDQPNLAWGHFDLFCFRMTSATFVKAQMRNGSHSGFYSEQIEIAVKVISSRQPKAVLICNAFASDMVLDFMKKKEKPVFDNEVGTYRLGSTPIYFSGMLSGPSPLDKGSRTRLAWQVGRCL